MAARDSADTTPPDTSPLETTPGTSLEEGGLQPLIQPLNSDPASSIQGVGTPTVTLEVSANTGNETTPATVITVTVRASAAVTGDQTVQVAVNGAGVTATDYTLSSTTITIASGQTTGTATFTILNDSLYEPVETATLTISNPSSGIMLGTTTTQNIAITSDDPETPSLVVTTTSDVVNPTDGVTSLREAIAFANTNPGADTITFDPGVFASGGVIRLVQGLGTLQVSSQVRIDGSTAGGEVVISGDTAGNDPAGSRTGLSNIVTAYTSRTLGDNIGVFNFDASSDGSSIHQLAISGGTGFGRQVRGGAIYAKDTSLTITDSTISGNIAQSGGGINFYDSGFTISGSTIASNVAQSNSGGISSNTSLSGISGTIVNSTVHGNIAFRQAGGIYNVDGRLTIENSTIAGNSAASGGGLFTTGRSNAQTTVYSSIIAGNTASANGNDVAAYSTTSFVTSRGNNLIGDGQFQFIVSGNPVTVNALSTSGSGDIVGTTASRIDPLLGTLADNGGPTETLLPQTGSPAINAGRSPAALMTDQRGAGFARDAGLGTDIGAVEGREDPSLIVTTANDTVNGFDGLTSLREAIAFANSATAGTKKDGDADNDGNALDTITFASGTGQAFENGGLIRLNSTLQISSAVRIDGSTAGGELIITGDKSGDDSLIGATMLSDVIGSAAGQLDDNVQVLNFDTTSDGSSLHQLTITGGSATAGGGIAASNSDLTISDSVIRGNVASNYGGGVSMNESRFVIQGSTIANNSAGFGGGLFSNTDLSGPVTGQITNSTIYANQAGANGGGGIRNQDGLLTIQNSTISGNSASIGGGVLSFGDATTRTDVGSTIIAGNTASTAGNDLSSESTGAPTSSFNSLGNNLIGDGQFNGTTFFTNGQNNDIVGTTATRVDPLLGTLADNGGPTPTLEPLPGSPAINKGANPLSLTTDQRGTGFARQEGSATDIGAVEYLEPLSLIVTTTKDVVNPFDGLTSLREAIALANNLTAGTKKDGDADNDGNALDTITFASGKGQAFENGGVIRLTQGLGTLQVSSQVRIDGSTAGGEVVISGDTAGNDPAGSRTGLSDISAARTANTLADNIRVFYFDGSSDGSSINRLAISGGDGVLGAYGGAILARDTALTITDSTISGNIAQRGGGIGIRDSNFTVSGSTIADNVATIFGGGIFSDTATSSDVDANTISGSIVNSTIHGNSATQRGGGVYNLLGRLTIENSTIAGNQAAVGGGVFSPGTSSARTTVYSSIVAGNTASTAGNDVGSENSFSSFVSRGNNLIGDGQVGATTLFTNGTNNDIVGTTATRIDPRLGTLANNGGPTDTLLPQPGSRAIDAGGSPAALTTDQRGAGFARDLGPRADIGAVETNFSLLVTTTKDVVDFTDGVTSLREAIFVANGKAGADTITFASGKGQAFENGGLIRLGSTLQISSAVRIDGSTAGGEVIITGDKDGDDSLIGATMLSDVIGSATSQLDDNVQVLSFDKDSDGSSLHQLTITGGSATRGGGIAASNSDLTITNSSIRGNFASYGGGGLHMDQSRFLVQESTIANNFSRFGGGLFSDTNPSAPVTGQITNSTFYANQATNAGGGIRNQDGTLSIQNSTISGNSAILGGGVSSWGDTATRTDVGSTIIAGNTASTTGNDLSSQSADVSTSSFNSLGNNLIGDGQFNGTTFFSPTNSKNDIVGTTMSPVDAQLGTLSDNGGPTLTLAPQIGSPVISKGTNPLSLTTDQRDTGFTRQQGTGIEIGAVEGIETPSLIVTTDKDVVVPGDNLTSLREALAFANSKTAGTKKDGDADNDGFQLDTITFDPTVFANGGVIRLSSTLQVSSAVVIDGTTPAGDIVITGDVSGNDTLVTGTNLTNIFESARSRSTADNVQVLNFDADSDGSSIVRLTLTGGTGGKDNRGGAVEANGTILTVRESTLAGNTASRGGGLYGKDSFLLVERSTFSGNLATTSGGGLFSDSAQPGSQTGVVNSTFYGNYAGLSGGGIYRADGPLSIANSTVTGNVAKTGGGIFSKSGAATNTSLYSTIVAGNGLTPNGLGNDVGSQNFRTDGFTSLGNNLIGDGQFGSTAFFSPTNVSNDIVGTTANRVDPLLGTLADNGGPTQTLLPQIGSRAINAGNSDRLLVTDQRGTGFAREFDGQADIGAVETEMPSLVVTTTNDVVASDGLTSLREALALANSKIAGKKGDGDADNDGNALDTITFDPTVFANGGLIRLNSTLQVSSAVRIDGSTAGGEVVITGDRARNDSLITGTNLTDIFTTNLAGNVTDNIQILNFDANSDGSSIRQLTLTGGAANSIQNSQRGGAIEATDTALSVVDSTLSGNFAGRGGGLYSKNSTLFVLGSTFNGNFAIRGGGLASDSTQPARITDVLNSTFHGNYATEFGGGIYQGDGRISIANSTVVANVSNVGGGITSKFGAATTTTLSSTIVAGNGLGIRTGAYGVDVASTSLTNLVFTSLGYNLIGDGQFGSNALFTNGINNDIVGTTANPVNALLGPLADNGGPTQTLAPQLGSPVINAGNSSPAIVTDQRGTGFARNNNGQTDIGAVETVGETPSLIVTTTNDVSSAADGLTSLREAIAFANSKAGADTITFASGKGQAFENGGLIRLNSTLQISSAVRIDGSTAGGEVIITGDKSGDDSLIGTTMLSDVVASTVSQLDDNVQVLNFDATSDGSSLHQLTITGGSAAEGGGIAASNSNLTISDSVIRGNVAANYGGGLDMNESGFLIQGSTIANNAARFGGGLFSNTLSFGSVTGQITNSTIFANQASINGGGVFNEDGRLTIQNSTISGNSAVLGGGVSSFGNVITRTYVGSTIIAGNTASTAGNDVASHSTGTPTSTFSSLGNNLIGDGQFNGTNFFTNGTNSDIVGTTATPVNAQLGTLADNGGPTPTLAPQLASPAINNGANPLSLTTDQRGTGFVRVEGGAPDIGAVETESGLVVTTTKDVVNALDGLISLREAIAFANVQAGADTITFAAGKGEAFENGGLIRLTQGQLMITDTVTINGAGNVTITGDRLDNDITVPGGDITNVAASLTDPGGLLNDNSRIFIAQLSGPGAAPPQPTFDGLTLTGGRAPGIAPGSTFGAGGAIWNVSSDVTVTNSTVSGNLTALPTGPGGGIYARGVVTLINSTVSDNVTLGQAANGGGISGRGGVTLVNSTIEGNSTRGVFAEGGGIDSAGPVLLINSTVSGNSTLGVTAEGGGIAGNTVSLINSTVSGNSTQNTVSSPANQGQSAVGGGVYARTSLALNNSLVLGNIAVGTTGADVGLRTGATTSYQGGNIVGATLSQNGAVVPGTIAADDVIDTTVTDNGGPVQTIALKASLSNPAIDAGGTPPTELSLGVDVDGDGTVENDAISVDARGFARSSDVPLVVNNPGPTDIGAFEIQTTPTPGPDILEGTVGNDSLAAAAGNDLVLPGLGDDIADGGTGTGDTVSYENLADSPGMSGPGVTVSLASQGSVQDTGAAGNDLLTGFENLTGSSRADTLTGDANDNTIVGGLGNDTINGGAGNDSIVGGPGNDTIDGGEGDDEVFSGLGNDSVNGGAGIDRIDFSAFTPTTGTPGISVDLSNTGAQNTGQGVDTIRNVEIVIGSGSNDTITGGTGDESLFARGGDDTLQGGVGNDGLFGQEGNDTLQGGAGNDDLFGGSGIDTVSFTTYTGSVSMFIDLLGGRGFDGDAQGDRYFSIENVIGSAIRDAIYGGDDANTIWAGGGDDAVIGQRGDDVIYGGIGNDFLAGLEDNDTILPGLGNDTVDGGSGSNDTVSYADLFDTTPSRNTFGVRVSLADQGSVQVTRGNPNRDPSIGAGNDLLTGFENLTGSGGVDNLFGDANDNILRGLENADALTGAGGNDTIFGGAGSDILVGGAGADVLYGGDGTPNLDRASWRSEASGVVFDFTTPFSALGNRTSAVVKEDTVFGIEGWEGSFTQFNEFDAADQAQSYNFFGGQGGNVMYGGDGGDGAGLGRGDGLVGFNGVDSIFGNEGGDIIWGRRSDDYLDAGRTADGTATDGDADQFNFEQRSGNDTVANFEVGLDFVVINRANLDDSTSGAANDGVFDRNDLQFSTVNVGGDGAIADAQVQFTASGGTFTSTITFLDVDATDLRDNGIFAFFG